MTDLFTSNGTNVVPASSTTSVENPLDVVKQKFQKDGQLDVEGLAKGKVEADSHISRLELELRGLREDLNSRMSYEQFLDEIKSTRAASTTPTPSVTNEPITSSIDIQKLIKETINNERTQSQKDSNRALVATSLRQAWGDSFQSKLASKANELNLSREFLTEVANTNPQAFLKLVDATPTQPQQTTSVAPPQTTIRPGTGPSNKRNNQYYVELRRKEPSKYWTPTVQNQMAKDALALRDEFYN